MSPTTAFIIDISGALIIGLIAGLILQKQGYSFSRYFVTGFLDGAGILGIALKIIMDYL